MVDIEVLAESNRANIERAKTDRNLAFTTYPEFVFPEFVEPCRINILMVTDGGGSFTLADFGLVELLSVLSVSPGPYVRFAVTKAHRGSSSPSGAHINNFRFDNWSLAGYDQIWLFGVARTGPLTDSELKALTAFMDAGGGVFATGDHEDLGVAMSGRVPRVRSMRAWYWPNEGPNGEPIAPRVDGPSRHDTNHRGAANPTIFADQSDDIPQVINPNVYRVPGATTFLREYVYPHPLLCGPKGAIRYLPDHPHEGDCYVPTDLTKTYTFGGSTFTEYPTLPDGKPLPPEVIATSQNGLGISDFGKGAVAPATFGAIGAYDGHRVGVGRVVVDATWHHFFNVNLIGDPAADEPAQKQGFYASPAGMAKYEEIKAYFRNIAVWLARPETHQCMRWRTLWDARWHSRLVMDFRVYENIRDVQLDELIRVGTVARDVLGRLASQCQSLQWIFGLLEELLPRDVMARMDPWSPNPAPRFDPGATYYGHVLVNACLGSILYTIADRYPEPSDEAKRAVESEENRELVREAVAMAAQRVSDAMRETAQELVQLADFGGPVD